MNSPLLSVIVPTFDRARLLAQCTESVAALNLPCFELVIVDDGSTDNSEDLAREAFSYAAEGAELVYIRQDRSGAQVARNRGIKAARGQLIIFLDADDILNPRGVEALVSAIERTGCELAHGIVELVDENLRPFSPKELIGESFSNEASELAGYHWQTMGAIFRRELIDRVGEWNIELTGSQDWEYQARTKLHARSHIFVEEVVGLWRQHTGPRVGAKSYRKDYVHSVVRACQSIANCAIRSSKYNPQLAERLAKKVFRHAIQASANGAKKDAKQYLEIARTLPLLPLLAKSAIRAYELTPRQLDQIVASLLHWKN